MRGTASLQFFGSDLEWVASAEISGEERYFLAGNLFPRPLGRRTVIAASEDRFAVGTQDDPEVVFVDSRGAPVQILRWPRQDREVRSEDIEAYIGELVDASPGRAAEVQQMYRDHEFPALLPAFGSLIVDETGRLWVEQTQRPGSAENSWTVFSAAGAPLATVELPERFIPHFVGTDRIAGVWRDELDVEYVFVFELPRALN